MFSPRFAGLPGILSESEWVPVLGSPLVAAVLSALCSGADAATRRLVSFGLPAGSMARLHGAAAIVFQIS